VVRVGAPSTLTRSGVGCRSPFSLEPANSRMKPIFVKDVVIQGVVKGLVRRSAPASERTREPTR